YGVKSAEPVWRPRPLFNGRLAFMTDSPGQPGRFRVAQADWGYIRSAPSSLPVGDAWTYEGDARLTFGPDTDADGRKLPAACASPYPGGLVLFAAAPAGADARSFGLYLAPEDWTGAPPVPQVLFDDPAFVDAEPVAVYARAVVPEPIRREPPLAAGYDRPAQ